MTHKKKTVKNTTNTTSNNEAVNHVLLSQFKKKQLSQEQLNKGILNNNISCLSQAITLVESTNTNHTNKANNILKQCLPHANDSIRIGITGVPGVGKSTFIESFGTYLSQHLKKRIAILAIDPSSTLSKGSILGDKTRMKTLAKNTAVFIRPSASGDTLGGVARKTRETIILCEAAGYDIIIIETVGVGQNETAVHNMVDFFMLLKLAGAGDELQGIKRGVIELADAIAINKCDGNNIEAAKLAKNEFEKALQLFPKKASGWLPKVTTCSALNNDGIEAIWQLISEYINATKQNDDYFNLKRFKQNKFWLNQAIENQLKAEFFNNSKIREAFPKALQRIENKQTTAFIAADYLLNTWKKSTNK